MMAGTMCKPVAQDPLPLGAVCEVGASFVDACGPGAFCLYGRCTAACECAGDALVCANPAECGELHNFPASVCTPTCNPIGDVAGDCPVDYSCYPNADDSDFICAPFAATGDPGEFGDECEFINECIPGSACAPAAYVPGCAYDGCCTPLCDLSEPSASASCPGAEEGQICAPFFEQGEAPEGLEDVGWCRVR